MVDGEWPAEGAMALGDGAKEVVVYVGKRMRRPWLGLRTPLVTPSNFLVSSLPDLSGSM